MAVVGMAANLLVPTRLAGIGPTATSAIDRACRRSAHPPGAPGAVDAKMVSGRSPDYALTVPACRVTEAFQALAGPMLTKIIENVHEARTLAATRDLLLPRLMSGELRVQDVDGVVETAA